MERQNSISPSHPIMVVVQMQSAHISQDELYTITLALVKKTREEPGCIDYNCYKNIDDDSVMEVILFENTDAHQAHMSSPHVLAFLDKYQSLNLQYAVQRVNYSPMIV
ncbi:putative quinol monooxygenase [Vibrio sp. E150_011]